jgi:hypothetical protein
MLVFIQLKSKIQLANLMRYIEAQSYIETCSPQTTKDFRPLPFKNPATDSRQTNIKYLPGHDDHAAKFSCQ